MAFGEVMMRMQVPGFELLRQANQLQYSFSGTGVNIASALTSLGYHGYLMTTLPNNAIGDAAVSFIQKLGVDPAYIQRSGDAIGMYFLENGFGSRPSRVTYTHRPSSSFNTAGPDAYPFAEAAEHVDLIHLCGISLAMNGTVRSQMKALASSVLGVGGQVLFDCNFRPAHWRELGYGGARPFYEEMLHLADYVMMNEKDALHILGVETARTDRVEQLIDVIPTVANRYGIRTIAGTHRHIHQDSSQSLRGYIYQDGEFRFSPSRRFTVLDRIGTGDAYTAGVIYGLFEGFSLQKTVDFAVASSMLAHTTVGDTPMSSLQEILKAMTEGTGDIER